MLQEKIFLLSAFIIVFKKHFYCCLIVLLIFASNLIIAQNQSYQNAAQPLIKYFSPKEYRFGFQNWKIIQDKRGLMYFGNDSGILEYDGKTWRSIKTANNSVVRSLCLDSNGIIYVTASSDFGYLAPDSIGQLRFVSLLENVEKQVESFGDVWDVEANSKGIYFKTSDRIFRWYKNKITTIDSVFSYRLYKINDEIFTRNNGSGLQKITGNSLSLIPNGERFSSIGVYDMLPFKDEVLVTTNRNGLFLYNGNKFSQFKTEADSFLVKNRLYNSCELNNGNFAFATQRGGVAIIDKNGKLIQIINTNSGLQTNVIYDVSPDKQGGLWLTMTEGITRVEISSPFIIIPKEKTGNNFVSSLFRFNNLLYASNVYGFFYLSEKSSKFKPVLGISNSAQNIISIDNILFGTTISNIYKISNENNAEKLFDLNVQKIYQSKIDTNIVYYNRKNGIGILKYENDSLKFVKNLPEIKNEISNVIEDEDGSLWVSTLYEGVYRISSSYGNLFSNLVSNKIDLESYSEKNGFPGNLNSILSIENKLHFATDKGLFRFNKSNKTFIPDSILGINFVNSTNTILMYDKNKNGDLWILANTKN